MDLENKNINSLRVLAVDMIENAKSGHPGIALGAAPILYSLYSKHLNVVPDDDKNIFRDRFVMSAGHGSSILYATLFAFGYNIKMEDLQNFRKLDSITPGHPEYNITPGVDASTGPLGQGVASAVGLAIAQRIMAKKFNKPDLTIFDNYTYALVGEGCLMEGVSYEALSLAGSLRLNKLIVLYDCNRVTLDSSIDGVMEQNILGYMKSLNFNTIEVLDGNNVEEINQAIIVAKSSKEKPTFIKINTHIGYGSVYQDSNKSHGNILGADNTKLLREKFNITEPPFVLNKDVVRDLMLIRKRFDNIKKNFKERIKLYSKYYPGDYQLLKEFLENKKLNSFNFLNDLKPIEELSGRDMGALVLNKIADNIPNIICGTADLSSSTKVIIKNSGFVNDNFDNRNIRYGIREFAMGCINNGIALYGGLIPIDSTFMVFSDYMKSALRLRAMMGLKSISVFTHDSIAVGEDGATHEACEQLWALRDIPNNYVFRPCNLEEVKASYYLSMQANNPSCMVLSRQKLSRIDSNYNDALMGGYIIDREDKGILDGIIIATGSEVKLAIDTKNLLKKCGYNIRVVSMPSIEIFELQSDKYKKSILPENIISVFSIEAGHTSGWHKYVGKFGKCYGVDTFGYSGKPDDIFKKFNLTSDFISKDIVKVIKENKKFNIQ